MKEVVIAALNVLKDGGIVAYPTESFYALGVMANDKPAVDRLFAVKKRPLEKALPLIVGSKDVLKAIVKEIPCGAEELIKKYWPGPLTILFDANNEIPGLLSGKNKIAARIPGECFALSLASAADFPITATSANVSGEPPAISADEVINYFGENIDLIIDAGTAPGGKPSTIVDATVSPPKVLREGSIILS